jgi:hypothetical protein
MNQSANMKAYLVIGLILFSVSKFTAGDSHHHGNSEEEFSQEVGAEASPDEIAKRMTSCPGSSPGRAASSCRAILRCHQNNAPSRYYWIRVRESNRIVKKKVYCDMEDMRCGISGGWMRVAHIDMTDPDDTCPSPLNTITSPKRMCVRPTTSGGCYSVFYSTHGIPYSRVCGRALGYAYRSPDAFDTSENGINGLYVDGLSITHGADRKHIWTFAAGLSQNGGGSYNCPCANVPGALATFVDNDYFCESGNRGENKVQWYLDDPLWDGKGCVQEDSCCSRANSPWFCKSLPTETTDYIEVRLCCNQASSDENLAVEQLEIYVI